MSALWDDVGPSSQGKIITAVLKQDDSLAGHLLKRWAPRDLDLLEQACRHLELLITKERVRRRP